MLLTGQTDPKLVYQIATSEHPLLESRAISSTQDACNKTNILFSLLFIRLGVIDTETLNITIKEGLDNDTRNKVIIHEECHKKQLKGGKLNLSVLGGGNCFGTILQMERECYYAEEGLDYTITNVDWLI